MPTIFSHAVAASAIGAIFGREGLPTRFWILTALCAALPDIDVVGFTFGIRYNDLLGHRGLTHSFAFALFVGVLVVLVFFRKLPRPASIWALIVYFTVVTASHPLLDAMTDGGRGVALLAPFSNARYFFPWRPIKVSPIGLGFFSERGIAVAVSEFLWIWLPSLAVIGSSALLAGWNNSPRRET